MSQNIQQLTPFEGLDQITIGNGQGLNINSLGVSSFLFPLKPNLSLVLSNMLFVSSITKNLICVSQFCKDNDVFFEFHSCFCLVKSQETKKILLQGLVGCDGLYQFPALQSLVHWTSQSLITADLASVNSPFVNKNAYVSIDRSDFVVPIVDIDSCKFVVPIVNTVACSSSSFSNWHSRLSNPSVDAMKIVFKLCNVPPINKMFLIFAIVEAMPSKVILMMPKNSRIKKKSLRVKNQDSRFKISRIKIKIQDSRFKNQEKA